MSGSISAFAATVVSRVAVVINSIVTIRVLGPNDYGVLNIVTLLFSFVAIFATFQISTALVKFLAAVPPSNSEEASRLIGTGFVLTIISTAISVSVILVLTPFLALSVYGDSRLEWLIPVACIGTVLSAFASPFLSTFQGFERIKEMSLRSMAYSILTIPITIILVTLLGLTGALLGMIASGMLSLAVNFTLLRSIWRSRRLRFNFNLDHATRRKILAYALPAFSSSAIVTACLLFSNSLLKDVRSWVEVGQFAAGFGLGGYLQFISAAIGLPLIPIVSKLHSESPEDLPQFMMRTYRVVMFIALIPTLLLIAMPEPFLRILYSSAYVGAADVVRLMAPAFYLGSLGSIVGYGMYGTGQMWGALLLNGLWAIPFVILTIILVPVWGDIGLSTAVLISYAVLAMVALAFSKYSWSVEVRHLGSIFLIAAVSFPVAEFLSLVTGSWLRFMFAAMLATAVFIVGYLTLSEREKEVLTAPLRRVVAVFRRT